MTRKLDTTKSLSHLFPGTKVISYQEGTTTGATSPEAPPEEAQGIDFPDFFYDAHREKYLFKNGRGRWLANSESQFKRRLRKLGFSKSPKEGQAVSDLDDELLRIQNEDDVDFAGRLAGYPDGFIEMNGNRVLVTEGPRLIEPQEGEWPILERLLSGLLGEDPTQIDVFKSWIKVGLEMYRSGLRQAGQALVLAGPANCGKSLVQQLITELFGGRGAKASMFLTGRTDFNSELFGAEHLMLEDEAMSKCFKDRTALGQNIKGLAVNDVHACHPKGRPIINLRPLWRASITVNDDVDSLQVLPPMTGNNLADKFVMLRCTSVEMPMPTETAQDQREFWRVLESELPAFVNHLEEFEIPDELRDNRYGVASYHNKKLAMNLNQLSPESFLLELIDQIGPGFYEFDEDHWRGTANELRQKLLSDITVERDAKRLLDFRGSAGTYLSRLAKSRPDRVRRGNNMNGRSWVIAKPDPEEWVGIEDDE